MKQSRVARILAVFVFAIITLGMASAVAFAETPSGQQDASGALAPGDALLLTAQDGDTVVDSFGFLANGQYTLENGKTYSLSKDFLAEGRIFVPHNVEATIELNGHSLKRNLSTADIKGQVILNEGTLTIKGGNGGSATIAGGRSSVAGGGISNSGTLHLERVLITGNATDGIGGGIFNNTSGTVSLKGSSVIGNTASGQGGGIYQQGILAMSGRIDVTNNGNTNLFLASSKVIGFDGELDTGSDIGITTQSYQRYLSSGFAAAGNGSIDMFRLENAPAETELVFAGGELYAKRPAGKVVSSWSELQKALDTAGDGQVIELSQSITATDSDTRLQAKSGKDVILDLAGHALSRGLSGKSSQGGGGHVIYVPSNATLTIRDTGGAGKITGGNANNGGGINVGGTLIVEGGAITGNNATESGGGVYVSGGGSLTMTYGSITDNKASKVGGGICNNGTVALSHCTISTNTAKTGGGIYTNHGSKAFNATGVIFDQNDSTEQGGGIYLQSGKITIAGGEFTKNTSEDCGGIFVTKSTTAEVTGATFNSNKSMKHSGGGLVNFGTTSLTDCNFTANSAFNHGGGIYTNGSSLTVTRGSFTQNSALDNGGAIVSNGGTVNIDGGTYTENTSGLLGGAIAVVSASGAVNIAGDLVVQDNRAVKAGPNIFLAKGKKLNVSGPMKDGAHVGVSIEDYSDMSDAKATFTAGYKTSNGSSNPTNYFFCPEEGYTVGASAQGEVKIEYTSWLEVQELIDAAPNGGTVTLKKDYTNHPVLRYLYIGSGKDVTLDLNGHTLLCHWHGDLEYGNAAINVSGTLTIIDSKGDGKITGGNGGQRESGGVYLMPGGTVNLESGAITGNTGRGGGVLVHDGATFNMSGGTISDNTSIMGGGGVFVLPGGTFNFTGGTIENNHAAQSGGGIASEGTTTITGGKVLSNTADNNAGGIWVHNDSDISNVEVARNIASKDGGGIYSNGSNVSLANVSITDNEAGGYGGGVYMPSGKTLSVEGSLAVEDNRAFTGKDIYLDTDNPNGAIAVTDELTCARPSIGVTLKGDVGTFTTGFSAHNYDDPASYYFFASDSACAIVTRNGEAALEGGWTLLQQQINEAKNGETIRLENDVKALSHEKTLMVPAPKNITIDLNGHTINRNKVFDSSQALLDGTGHAIIVGTGAKLTVKDNPEITEDPITGEKIEGSIAGGVALHGGGIYVSGTLELASGVVTGNFARGGGGVYVAAGGDLLLTGGAVRGNKVGCKDGDNEILGFGGGIVSSGTIRMSAGAVSGNVAYTSGGGIYVGESGSFSMDGGLVDNNVSLSTNTLNGGGGIFNGGTVVVRGGSIASNLAMGRGGALDTQRSAYIEGGEIKGNRSMQDGGGIYYMGDLHLKGGTVEGNTADGKGGGVVSLGTIDFKRNTFFVSGSPVVKDNESPRGKNIVLAYQDVMDMSEGSLDAADLHFVAINIPRKVTKGLNTYAGARVLSCFTYDKEEYGVGRLKVRDGELYVDVQADVWVSSWKELQQAINKSQSGQVIGLKNDITPESGDTRLAVDGKNVVIELAGHSIDRYLYFTDFEGAHERGYSEDGGHVIWVAKNSTLTVRDASDGLGEITGGNAKRGGGVYVSGTFNLEGGTITENHSREVAGGVYVNSGATFNVMSGAIEQNKTAGLGGGICADGTVELSDLLIRGNEAKQGGGIYANTRSRSFNMQRTKVDGNTATSQGGGIYLQSGKVEMEEGSLLGNVAKEGGGVYLTEDTIFGAKWADISNNTASEGLGGAIRSYVATANLSACTVNDNVAHSNGGAIYSSGATTLASSELRGNSAYDNGGAVMIQNGGKLTLDNTTITENKASSLGGGIYMGDNADYAKIKGSIVVAGNKSGGDVFLANKKKLTVAGPLLPDSNIKVLLEKTEGVITTGFSKYHSTTAEERCACFGSSYGDGYEAYLKNGEVAVRTVFAEGDDAGSFVKRPDQIVGPNASTVMDANWMHGISGDRYLNEINIPYTHDSAMKEAYAWRGSSIGAALGFSKNARTQYLYIDEQLDAGIRIFDLRLNNKYNHHTWWDEVIFYSSWVIPTSPADILGPGTTYAGIFGLADHCTSDDGSNLWLCHGKDPKIGIFWGEDHDGDQLNLKQVLRWAEDFLRQHPSETVVLNFDAEVNSDSDKQEVWRRLRNHMKEVYGTINPSTGKSYLYQEEGSAGPFEACTHMPQLKECRGQIVIMGGGGDVHGIKTTTGGLRSISDGTSNSVSAGTKIEQLNKFYSNYDYKLPTNANQHLNYIIQPDTNSKADDFPEILDADMRPLKIAARVHPFLFREGGVFNNENTPGTYFGWVKMDGARAGRHIYHNSYDDMMDDNYYNECRLIYESNFFDGLEYVTVKAKPSIDADESQTQSFDLLKYTDITIPECIYDNPKADGGNFIGWMAIDKRGNVTVYQPGDPFEVAEDITFVAMYDNDKTPRAKVYEVFQEVDGSWEEPTEVSANVMGNYKPLTYNHFTVSGYSTAFTDDEKERTALSPGSTIKMEVGKGKLYVYYARKAYDLVFYQDMAGTKVAKTVKVPYETPLSFYEDEWLPSEEGLIFAGWSTSPRTDGELYFYEDTIPDKWKDEDVAREHPYVLYRFRDKMPGRTFNLYPVFRAEADEPTFRTHSLLLDGSIGVHFFMELPKMAEIDYSTSYMEFSVSGRGSTTSTDPFDPEDRNKERSYYGFTCYVNSIQMADTITATFHYTVDGEEREVSQDYSIAQYINDFEMLSEDFDETTVNLVHALADYGHYAQQYLSKVHGWDIGTDYASLPERTALTPDMVADARKAAASYAVESNVPAGGEVKNVSMGLDLASNTTACLYVTMNNGAGIKSCGLADGTSLQAQELSDGRWLITVPGIMAHHLDEVYYIQITTTGGTSVRARASALSYAQAVFDAEQYSNDMDAQYLATALMRYWQAADDYLKAHAR